MKIVRHEHRRSARGWFYFKTWGRWAEVMWQELASDRSCPDLLMTSWQQRSEATTGSEQERGVASDEGGGARPSHIILIYSV